MAQIDKSSVHESVQIMIGCVGRCHDERLAPAFLGKARAPGIWHPYLDRAQSGCAKSVAALLDTLADGGGHE
jgi:hypothetical protein